MSQQFSWFQSFQGMPDAFQIIHRQFDYVLLDATTEPQGQAALAVPIYKLTGDMIAKWKSSRLAEVGLVEEAEFEAGGKQVALLKVVR